MRSSGRHFDFSVVSLEQLSVLFQTRPTDEVVLALSNISPAQSEFLAQLPYPISINILDDTLAHCRTGVMHLWKHFFKEIHLLVI